MKIEVGKFYKDRKGRKVKITEHDKIHSIFYGKIYNVIKSMSWSDEGRFNPYMGEMDFDIVSEWTEEPRIEGWVNIYNDKTNILHPSKSVADKVALLSGSNRTRCIKVREVRMKKK